jgi:hypothetical protein
MRLTIIKDDRAVYINGEAYEGLDLSWIPTFDGKEVHAVQWYDDHGHIEFTDDSDNMDIDSLGVFERVVPLWETRKQEIFEYEQEQLRLIEEARQAQIRAAEEQLAQELAEEEMALKAAEELALRAEELALQAEQDLYYDIEELLKEI